MSSCTACGHQLGAGRFCTNCGAPVDAATPGGVPDGASGSVVDTAERAVPIPADPPTPATQATTSPSRPVDPRTPPSAVAPPPPPRYPLYADEVDDWRPYGPLVATQPPPATPAEPVEAQPRPQPEVQPEVQPEPISAGDWGEPEPAYDAFPDSCTEPAYEEWDEADDGHRSPLLWVLAAVVVLGVVATGWYYLARDTGGGTRTATDTPSQSASPTDVASKATAKAPRTAPPNEDVNHQQVAYDASNMLDGDPETAWRVAGSGAGMTLTFTLPEATTISSVGMINGYAKTSKDDQGRVFDWYAGNRRIKAVVWGFDDGTRVRQQLKDKDPSLQSIDVDSVTTTKITLKIVRVTNPGTGTAARNFTAISEVSLRGVPGS